ncbi:MAG: 4-hydroxythreonine-4-phosphate dehydrogenase PdxA [Pirellulaceae bacterium]
MNPHAGEHGLFGNREEETIIIPAMQQAKQLRYQPGGAASSGYMLCAVDA